MGMSRQALASWLDRTKILALLLRLRSRFVGPWLPVLTYHRVTDVPSGYRFDPEVIDCTPDHFDEQMQLLARHFTPIGVKELVAYLDGDRSLPNNPVMVTFDDGYRDNHEQALPILRKHGIKAVFFITTDVIEKRCLFWWDRVVYTCREAAAGHRGVARIDYPCRVELDFGDPSTSSAMLLALVKDAYQLDLDRFLAELGQAAGVELGEQENELAEPLLMSWEQIRELHREGMDVQSHTCTHQPLHTLRHAQLCDELERSRSMLQQKLGGTVTAISYPAGRNIAHLPTIERVLKSTGYRLGFSNGTGPIPLRGVVDPFALQRIAMDCDISREMFRGVLAFPPLDHGAGS